MKEGVGVLEVGDVSERQKVPHWTVQHVRRFSNPRGWACVSEWKDEPNQVELPVCMRQRVQGGPSGDI